MVVEKNAEIYVAKSWIYRELYVGQYIYQIREMGIELQERYGVTEIEAINILNGKNIIDYVEKYRRIRELISRAIKAQEVCDRVSEVYYGEAV